MPSKLLSTLRRIDAERMHTATILENKLYPVNKKSHYGELNKYILDNLPSYNLDNEDFIIDEDTGVKYYDNPEDDPEVWKKPQDWPDIENIYRNTTVLINEETTDINKKYYLPKGIVLLTMDSDITTFKNNVSGQHPNVLWKSIEDSCIGLALSYGAIQTSDGQIYIHQGYGSSHTGWEHNWDISKDIVINNVHYRYFIYYQCGGYQTADPCLLFGNNIQPLAFVGAFQLNDGISSGGTNISGFTQGKQAIQCLQYLKFIDMRFLTFPEEAGVSKYYNYFIKSDIRHLKSVKRLEIELSDDYVLPSNASALRYFTPAFLNTLICNNKDVSAKLSLSGDLVYFKGPVIHLYSEFEYYAISSAGNSSSSARRSVYSMPLKYADINNELQKEMKPSAYLIYSTQGGSANNYGNYEYLRNIIPIIYATSITGLCVASPIRHCTDLKMYCTTTPNLNYMSFNSVDFVNLLTFSWTDSFAYAGIKKLWLSAATTISISTNKKWSYIESIIAPNVTKISSTSSSYNMAGAGIKEIYLPNLTSIPFADMWYGSSENKFLSKLTLGQGWKSTVNLNTLYSLSKESILDLFNKLAVLTEEEITTGYTITLPQYGPSSKANLTEEELAIATNKGWIIK